MSAALPGQGAAGLLAGRVARALLRRLRPHGGTSLPGKVALALDPGFIARRAAHTPIRVVVTGTNGKTSTTHLIAEFLAAGGPVVSNAEGANLAQGVASMLLDPPGAALVAEVDENAFLTLAPVLDPALVVVTGLFRDQLDRFGEVAQVRDRLARSIAGLEGLVLTHAADPLCASLAPPDRARYFAVEGLPSLDVHADVTACPRCGAPLVYTRRLYAHLGDYACTRCGFARPKADHTLRLEGDRAWFDDVPIPPPPRALHPASAAAALAALRVLGKPFPGTWPKLAWGRGEEAEIGGRHVTMGLAKNPASLSFALAWQKADHYVIGINDGGADGRDVSWLWDVNFPKGFGQVFVCGTRGLELLSRLRYLDPPPVAAAYASREAALAAALAATPEGGSVLFLSTYTGMRETQALLANPPAPAAAEPIARLPAPIVVPAEGPTLRLVHLFPVEMGTYGDVGNIVALAQRLRWRGRRVETVSVAPGEALPEEADFFLMGGGEDRAQAQISEALCAMRARLAAWIEDDVAGLLVCGGLQMFGRSYATAEGVIPGLGLLPLVTEAGEGRLVGRLRARADGVATVLNGFENHSGRTRLDEGHAFASVVSGNGNADRGCAGEGMLYRRVIATYLHGPLLARNPWLADEVAGWILARRGLAPPAPLDDRIEQLAADRLAAEAG